ncbi:MAG: carboxy terminal-processing peptidase, partial [Planctomycetaceae bacterium]|nr:carboxy terminal-processing peptidase [Planctomycetaceae bacterium]
YLSALTKSVDPHAEFLSEETMAQYNMGMIRLAGIGMKIVEQDGYLVVQEIIPGGTADFDGEIEAGDRLIGVADDSVPEFLDVWKMKLGAVYDAIRGPLTSTVRVQILKPTGDIKVHKLKRAGISGFKSNEQTRSCIVESSGWIAGTNVRIGILKIPKFYRDYEAVAARSNEARSTIRDVRHILQQFNSENVDAVVVDLRGNGGGSLQDVLDVCRSIVGDGPMVQIVDSEDPVISYQSDHPQICWQKATVVVCNRSTAWNAELFAAAIQDYQRGIVIGDARTHGKGTVQHVVDVKESTPLISPTYGAVKGTMAALFRVTGNSIQYAGVTSDIVLPSLSEVLNPGEESLENAMKFEPIPPAKYTPATTYVSDSIIAETSERSRARVLNSPDFKNLAVQIQRHVTRVNEKSVSLNQTDAEARMKESNAEEDLARQIASNRDSGEVFPRNYYNIELVHIATDYIQLLKAM